MDSQRIKVAPQQITEYFAKFFENISGAQAHFAFSMDEMSHQEWANDHEKICIIQSEHQGDIYYPVRRNGKRIMLPVYISANGAFVKPCIVICRKIYD